MKRRKSLISLIVVALVTLLAGVFVVPPAMRALGFESELGRPYRFGLDIAGGAELIYEVDMSEVSSGDRESVINGLRDVIERRVNLFGVSEPRVVSAKSGDIHRLIVELAGVRDVSEAIREIGETPLLDFREVRELPSAADAGDGEVDFEVDGEAEVTLESETEASGHDDSTAMESSDEPAADEPQIEFVPTDLTGRYVDSAQLGFDQTTGEPLVFLEFDSEGAKLFETITTRNVGRPLSIFLDGELISSPIVQTAISGGRAQITGSFTVDEARELVERFNAGALPAPIQLVSQQTVDAILGQRALSLGVTAGILGTIAVIIFMIIYYGTLGIFASVALIMYVLLTIAIFKLVPVTLTLAGIAGFILSVGMAVDANILIFERTREEIDRGMSKGGAIEEGFRRAWPSIRDSNISTIITALVLYFFTTSIVRGFALTLLIGVLVSMFSAITITRNMLRVFVKKVS